MSMAAKRKKITWTNQNNGGTEIESAIKRAFHPPAANTMAAAKSLDGRTVGDVFVVEAGDSKHYDCLVPTKVTRSPFRWLLPSYAAYTADGIRGAIGFYTGLVRTEELKEWDAKVVTSRLRHTVVVNGERFLVHDDFALRFLDIPTDESI
jgi:hypothetical protein